jgi:Tfp pilus assembly protein PilN
MTLREINLVPADIFNKKYLSRRLFLWAGCLTLCLFLIFGFYLYQVRIVLPQKRPMTTLADMHKHLGSTLDEIQETQQEIQRLSLQESFLKELTRTQPFSTILLTLSDIINTRSWLTKLAIDAGKEETAALPGIALHGFSLSNDDLGDFLTQLSGEPLFYNVVLKYAQETRIAPSSKDRKVLLTVIRFEIYCNVVKS